MGKREKHNVRTAGNHGSRELILSHLALRIPGKSFIFKLSTACHELYLCFLDALMNNLSPRFCRSDE